MDIAPYIACIRRHVPRLSIRTAVPILSGADSLVLDVNGECIFRLARRPEVEARYEKELVLLPILAKALPVAVPQVEYVGIEEGRIRFIGYRKLSGVPLDHVLARGGNEEGLERALANTLSALHRVPVERAVACGIIGYDADEWKLWYRRFYILIQEDALWLVEPVLARSITREWEEFLSDATNFRFRTALIHADFAAEHILCAPSGDRVVGIIDWSDATIGDPALDFAGLFHDIGECFTDRVLARYTGEVDESFRRRIRFYARIIPFHDLRFALVTGDEDLRRNALAEISREFGGAQSEKA